MNAGRELDALVAEKVMGRAVNRDVECVHEGGIEDHGMAYADTVTRSMIDGAVFSLDPLPYFSTSIADAWLVVEKMKADGWRWDVHDCPDYGVGAVVQKGDDNHPTNWAGAAVGLESNELDEMNAASNMTVPYAICLAALRALGHDV